MSSLTEIAESILANAKRLDAYTASKGLPWSSFDHDSLHHLSDDLERCRDALVDSAQSLKQLALGPMGLCGEIAFSFTDSMSLRYIYRHKIPKIVPPDGEISFQEIARTGNLNESLVRRILQHSMSQRIFQEVRPGYVRHTAASRLLRDDPEAMDCVGFLIEESLPASAKFLEALEKYPGSEEPNETGFNVDNNTNDPFYVEIAKTPERARRFGGCMHFLTRGPGFDINHLIRGYDWAELDKTGGIVVDCGGGQGAVSRALASATSKLRFIVQDLPGTVEEGERILPEHLKDRITFKVHDFFTPQPVKGADVYFFRYIFHNWSDKYATEILQNLLPAMRKGSRVVIYEPVLSQVAVTSWSKRMGRNVDLIQAVTFNSLERTVRSWQELFAHADSRFEFIGTRNSEGSASSVIEAVYMPETVKG